MKRVLTVFLMLLCIPQLTGCSSQVMEQTDLYSKIRIARLSDQGTATVGIETNRFPELLDQLSGALKKEGNCDSTHKHKYLISLLTGDEVTMVLHMDEEGRLCKDGKKYASAKKAEKPIQISFWDETFEEASVYTTEHVAIETEGNPEVLVKSPPKRITGTENALEKSLCGEVDGWSYYIGTMPLEGTLSTVLWRENATGETQRLCSFPQPQEKEKRHELTYVERSLETSNGRHMFFSLRSAASHHYSLWRFDVEQGKLGEFFSYPCSNMIITEVSVQDKEKLGWVIQEENLMAIDMETGTLIYELSMTFKNAVLESLFYEPDSDVLIKEVELKDLGSGNIAVTITTKNKETGAVAEVEGYELNFITYRIARR